MRLNLNYTFFFLLTLFSFSVKSITVSGYVICSEDTNYKIAYAKVILKGSDNSVSEKICDSLGFYSLELKNGVTYAISATSDKKYKNVFGNEKLLFFTSNKKIIDLNDSVVHDYKQHLDLLLERIPVINHELIFFYSKESKNIISMEKIDYFIQILNDNESLFEENKLEFSAYLSEGEKKSVGKKN